MGPPKRISSKRYLQVKFSLKKRLYDTTERILEALKVPDNTMNMTRVQYIKKMTILKLAHGVLHPAPPKQIHEPFFKDNMNNNDHSIDIEK